MEIEKGDRVLFVDGKHKGKKGTVSRAPGKLFPDCCRVQVDLTGKKRVHDEVFTELKNIVTIMKKLILPKEALLRVLKKVKEVVSKHPTLDILSNIRIHVLPKAIELVATDQIVTIVAKLPCSHEEPKAFTFLLPFEFFLNIVGLIDDEHVTIETTGARAVISGPNDSYDIDVLESYKQFPKLPEFPTENAIGVDGEFITWLHRSLDSVGSEKDRPVLAKVLISIGPDSLTVASTSGKILFEKVLNVSSDATGGLLVSTKVVKAMKGFEQTTISWNDSHVAFASDNLQLIGTLQDEKYPNYKAIIPPTECNVIFKRQELIGAMEKAQLTAGSDKAVTFHMKKEVGMLVIESSDRDYNRKSVVRMPMDYDGGCEMIRFNPESMLKVLNQVEYMYLSMAITAPNKGVILKADQDPSYTGLIMPIY